MGRLESEWDLSGCVQGARNEIFALQPAPVQTSYMGFPATMGANFLPYLITDKVVAPDSCRHCYSENLALMPNCYFVNDYKHAHMVHPPPGTRTRTGSFLIVPILRWEVACLGRISLPMQCVELQKVVGGHVACRCSMSRVMSHIQTCGLYVEHVTCEKQ